MRYNVRSSTPSFINMSVRLSSQEKFEKRRTGAEICSSLVRGTCTFGDKCRYSHDVAAYLCKAVQALDSRFSTLA